MSHYQATFEIAFKQTDLARPGLLPLFNLACEIDRLTDTLVYKSEGLMLRYDRYAEQMAAGESTSPPSAATSIEILEAHAAHALALSTFWTLLASLEGQDAVVSFRTVLAAQRGAK